MLDFGLVREALQERGLLLQTLAPHLVRPVPFLYPLQHRVWERPYVGAGVALYDAMAARPAPRAGCRATAHLTRRRALREAPCLRKDALIGAIQYYDAQVDDARHTMIIARTAASYGALVANRARVIGFLREGERVTGAPAGGPGDRRASSRSAPSRSSTRPGCGPTRPRRWSASAASSTSGRPRASTWSCRATGSSPHRASSCAPRRACCSSSRGAGTGSSAPPTPTGTLDKAHPAAPADGHRLPARPRQLGADARR